MSALLTPIDMSNTCTICLNDVGTTNVTTLPCGHTFHYNCIMRWNQEHNSCPYCRTQIIQNDDDNHGDNDLENDGGDIPNLIQINDIEQNIQNILIMDNYHEHENAYNYAHNDGNEHEHEHNHEHGHGHNHDQIDDNNQIINQFDNDINNIINIMNNIINNIPNENNPLRMNLELFRDFADYLNDDVVGLTRHCFECNSNIVECDCCSNLMCNCIDGENIVGTNPFFCENVNMDRTCMECFNNRDAVLTTFLVDNPNIDINNNNFLRTHWNNYYVNHSNINLNYNSYNNFEDFIVHVNNIYNFMNQNMIHNNLLELYNVNDNIQYNDIMTYLFENNDNYIFANENFNINPYQNVYDQMVS